jgi:hypothetical protein
MARRLVFSDVLPTLSDSGGKRHWVKEVNRRQKLSRGHSNPNSNCCLLRNQQAQGWQVREDLGAAAVVDADLVPVEWEEHLLEPRHMHIPPDIV